MNKRHHHNARAEINLIKNDLLVNDQINNDRIACPSFVTDSNMINKRDKLENDRLKNDKFKDEGMARKNRVKDKIRDKSKVKNKKDVKFELKDKITHHKHGVKDMSKDHKDESKDKRSKDHKEESKDRSKDESKDRRSKDHEDESKDRSKDNKDESKDKNKDEPKDRSKDHKVESKDKNKEEPKDRSKDHKDDLKDRSKDHKDESKDGSKDHKDELKDRSKDHKDESKDRSKDHKDESRDRSKHRNDELKKKREDYKFKLKNKKDNKCGLKDSINNNFKTKGGCKDYKCMLKNNNSKNGTKDNDSKMKNDSWKNARSEPKYGGADNVNSTDDGKSKKDRIYKSENPEIRANAKKTIIAVKPESPLELKMEKKEIITPEKEKKRNISSEWRSKSKSKHAKKIDETCTSSQRKNGFVPNSQKNSMRIVREPWDISRKTISKNIKQNGESALTQVPYRLNHKFKTSPSSTADNNMDLTDIIGKADMEIENDKIINDIMNEKSDIKKNLLNSENAPDENDKSFDSISVRDVCNEENMIEYEMDMKKRFLKKLESNRKRTQISMFGIPSLPNDDGQNERKELLPAEKQCLHGIIKTSTLSDYETKYKTLKGNTHGPDLTGYSDLSICENEDTSALCKRLTNKMLIRSNFNKTCEKTHSQVQEKIENHNDLSLFDTRNRQLNRGKKRVSFATKCGLIYQNSNDDSSEKVVPLKHLKKIIHNLSNNKLNKVGLKKKRNMLNKKTWQYSSKLLKLFRNKSITFGKNKHLYQSIKKKPEIGEKLKTRIKSNHSSWSFTNKFHLEKLLLKESPKPIMEEELCKNKLEIKESNLASKQSSTPISLVGMRINNLTLRSYNINSNQLIQNNNLVICSTPSVNKKEIPKTASILVKNTNQGNFDCQNDFHFPQKDNLKRINGKIISGSINRSNLLPKYNLGNNENLSNLKLHCSFPDSSCEVNTGSACRNIKMQLTENDTNCSQPFLKPERMFQKEMKRKNFTNNNYLRRNNVASNYLREKHYGKYNLTNNAKNNQLLKQKTLWNRKNLGYSFGKNVNGSSYDPMHLRNIKRPDFISRLNKDCSDQILPNERRKNAANNVKTLNSFLCEDKLKWNRAGGENSDPPKIVIKDSERSLLEIKFSDKFSINVSGNEIKMEGFDNNDLLKGLTIVNNHYIQDDDVKTCLDAKLNTSLEKATEIENQRCSNGKFNYDSKMVKEYKTFVDKSSGTENDYVLHKVSGNNKDNLTADKNENKTESYSRKSSTCMVDVGTDCLSYNTISTSLKNVGSNGAKHPEIVSNCDSSNRQSNLDTSITQQDRNTFIEYNMPENINLVNDQSMNILKTMKIINHKEEYKKCKSDVGIQYDIGVTCLANQIQKSTSLIEKSQYLLHDGEEIKYIGPTFTMVDENRTATIEESLNVTNSDMDTDIFDFSALNISLPEQEIKNEPILLSNLRKCDDLSPPVSKKPKKSTKIEASDRNILAYLVKKVKTLINTVSGKSNAETSSNKLNQQTKLKTTLVNRSKIKSNISITKKQHYSVNRNFVNSNSCKGNANSERKNDNCENKLLERETVEENIIKKELQLYKMSNFKDFINDAVEKFLTTNLEFFPTNVGPIQISIKGGKNNLDNSNQIQNLNNFKKEIIPTNPTYTNKNLNNICLVSSKRIQKKNNDIFT